MQRPLIPSKLVPPPKPACYLPRARLDGLWDEWSAARLVRVTAGAGYGKTSFLATGVAATSRPVHWYSLDELDAEALPFVRHLFAAVTGGESSVTDPHDVLAETVHHLHTAGANAVLVLDDAQFVGSAPAVVAIIEKLVRYLPSGCTLVIASREPLDLPVAKLGAAGLTTEVTAAELAFTADEIAALYRSRGIELDDALAERVMLRTEGWAVGLEILLQGLPAPTTEALAAALDVGRDEGQGWFTYFAEEVLRRLPVDLRHFLRCAALLPRLDPELCDAALDRNDSLQVLADLHRRRLFVLRAGGRDRYRLHHLFRDFLRDVQAREGTARERNAVQRRAAAVLEARGQWADALAAHAEAGRPARVLGLIEQRGDALLEAGAPDVLRAAFAAVPAELVAARPAALLIRGRLHEDRGEWTEAEAAYHAALRRESTGRRRVELMSLVARIKLRRGRFEACLRLCRKALREPGRPEAAVRGRLLGMIGISLCDLGRLEAGEAHLRAARTELGTDLDEETEARTFYLLQSNIHYRRGEFPEAKEAARRALVVFRRRGDRRHVCHCLGVLAHISADACSVREARELAEEGLRLAAAVDYPLMGAYCHIALGRCALITEDLDRAAHHYAAARDVGEQVGESGLRVFPLLGLAETALRAGRRHEARTAARRALAAAEHVNLIYQVAQARALLGRTESPRATAVAHRREAEAIMRRVGMRHDLHRLLLERLADGDAGVRERPALLEEWLSGLVDAGHEFLATCAERTSALPLLVEALGLEPVADVAARLLVEAGEVAVPFLADGNTGSAPARVRDVLTRIGGPAARAVLGPSEETDAATRPLAIRALGPLEVECAGRRITLKDWRSRRALRLFQFLLVRRFRWVPRDEAVEALWPDTDADRGVNNLRQTLHVLRRTLGPDGAVHVAYHNESLRLDPGEGYAYDVERCESELDLAEARWSAAEAEVAAGHFMAADALYRGHFLAESPYEEFSADERERLRDRFLHDTGRHAAHLARERRWTELAPLARRAASLDPYHEEFHRRLIEALAGLGHRAEALEAYRHYEAVMVGELDLPPAPEIARLAERIAAG